MEAGALQFLDVLSTDTITTTTPPTLPSTSPSTTTYSSALVLAEPPYLFPPVPQLPQQVLVTNDPAEGLFSFGMAILFGLFIIYSIGRWCFQSRQRFLSAIRGFKRGFITPFVSNESAEIVNEQPQQQIQQEPVIVPHQVPDINLIGDEERHLPSPYSG